MRTIYRADRVRAYFSLILGASFVASGGNAIAGLGVRAEFVFFCLLGGIMIGVGVCIFLTRVVIDPSGLHKRAPFDGGFRASWDEIESWSVYLRDTDGDSLPHADFTLHDRRSGTVHSVDVSRPGFDAFLKDVRAHIGARETPDPGAPEATEDVKPRQHP